MRWQAASRLAAVTALGFLASCGQRSDSFLEQLATDGVRQIASLASTPAAPAPVPARGQLEQLPGPLLAISFADVPGTGFVTVVNATPDGYITYQDRTRRSIIVRGGLVTGLQGFRFDLSAVKTQRDDPVVFRTPVANWPATLYRNYQFSLKSTADFQISVRCRIAPVARERIVVFEETHEVTRVQEDCANDQRRFTNIYWAEADTGTIWRSTQWLGPRIQPMTIEVIRPHPASGIAD